MDENINDWISKKITSNDVVLFMKGTPETPQCGFSSQGGGILKYLGIEFSSVNVLDDESIRNGIKEYRTHWSAFDLKNKGMGGGWGRGGGGGGW